MHEESEELPKGWLTVSVRDKTLHVCLICQNHLVDLLPDSADAAPRPNKQVPPREELPVSLWPEDLFPPRQGICAHCGMTVPLKLLGGASPVSIVRRHLFGRTQEICPGSGCVPGDPLAPAVSPRARPLEEKP
jgi:hypothetical protein